MIRLLGVWDAIFSESSNFNAMVISALEQNLDSTFGLSNTDVQILFLDTYKISSAHCASLFAERIVTDNKVMFDHLIERKVPLTDRFEGGKTLLHLCA